MLPHRLPRLREFSKRDLPAALHGTVKRLPWATVNMYKGSVDICWSRFASQQASWIISTITGDYPCSEPTWLLRINRGWSFNLEQTRIIPMEIGTPTSWTYEKRLCSERFLMIPYEMVTCWNKDVACSNLHELFVLLNGGNSTRLTPRTAALPKALILPWFWVLGYPPMNHGDMMTYDWETTLGTYFFSVAGDGPLWQA